VERQVGGGGGSRALTGKREGAPRREARAGAGTGPGTGTGVETGTGTGTWAGTGAGEEAGTIEAGGFSGDDDGETKS
jgi:hypothetical protein